MQRARLLVLTLALLALGGCGTTAHRAPPPAPASVSRAAGPGAAPAAPGVVQRRGGGYYLDDGPGDSPPPNLELTPDAVPKDEPPLKSAANRPYVVFGKTYSPTSVSATFRQRGVASWYGRKFHGQKTSSGESYDMYGMTAAHPTLPIPSYVRVTNLANNRSVIVRVNDRGPFHSERIIDLSYTAALKLGYVNQGSTAVEIEQVHGDGRFEPPPVLLAAAPPPTPVAAAPPPAASAAPPAAATNLPPALTPVPVAPSVAPSAAPVVVSAPVAETRAVALPTSTQPDGVYLQLGAFGAREGAEEFRIKVYQQLSWLNDTIYIVARERLFRVQLGPYKDRAEAGVAAEKIRETLQFTPVFVLK
ncbi:MAG TPA: septal ring lytic transglycosylase RlpA family protein [Burkholderiales bacterium]|jgi:rare lipoprotein A|nr:septal ring lytic transglycosylase RlpA family protein [Burkholderiales bacterium]